MEEKSNNDEIYLTEEQQAMLEKRAREQEEQENKISQTLTPEEQAELNEYLGLNVPSPEEKPGIFTFFSNILKSRDSTKVANLDPTELFAIRKFKEGEIYSKFMGLDKVANYLKDEGEALLATSDSKEGFLIRAAITSKKDVKFSEGEEKKKRSTWFENNVANK